MKNLLLAFFLCSLAACSSSTSESEKFEREGVSFECPGSWSITDKDSLDGDGFFLSIEKKGSTESGLMTVTWIDGSLELEQFLSSMQEGIKNNIIYENSDIKFSQTIDTTFNNEKAIASRFNFSLIGIKHEGIIYCFNGTNKVISVLKQEAVEDKAKNIHGFEFIEKSFSNN